MLRLLRGRVGPDLTLIGVGGITTVQDAQDRLDAGADLLQGYTAFIYEGSRVAAADRPRGPGEVMTLHVTGEVLDTKRTGAYRHLTLVAPGVAERFRPGTFVAVTLADSARLARRSYWIHQVRPVGGYGPALQAGRGAWSGPAAPGWPACRSVRRSS